MRIVKKRIFWKNLFVFVKFPAVVEHLTEMIKWLNLTPNDLLYSEVLPEDFQPDKFSDLAQSIRLIYLLDLSVKRSYYHFELKVLELAFSFNFVQDQVNVLSQLFNRLITQKLICLWRIPDKLCPIKVMLLVLIVSALGSLLPRWSVED